LARKRNEEKKGERGKEPNKDRSALENPDAEQYIEFTETYNYP
jgi:hypothetical protein